MLAPAISEGSLPLEPKAVGMSQTWPMRLFFAFLSACGLGYTAYIAAFGQNIIFWDEWAWVPLVRPGGLTFQALWAQHNENIIFFPNLLAVLLIRATNWNDFAFFAVSAVFMAGTVVVCLKVFATEIKKSPLWWIPVPLLVCSLVQYQNILWAFQIAWPMIIFLTLASLALLAMTPVRPRNLLFAVLMAILASYSSLQGLIVWPCGLLVLLARGQPKKLALAWSVVGLITVFGYFVDFSVGASGTTSLSYLLTHETAAVTGLLIAAGSVVPSINSAIPGIGGHGFTEVIGAILFMTGAAITVLWVAQGRPSGARAFCVALILITVIFDLLLLPGRLVITAEAGTVSRYSTFNWPILLGVYGYAIIWLGQRHRWRPAAWIARGALVSLVLLQVVVATIVGVNQGQIARTVRMTSTDVLANWKTAPAAMVGPYLYPPCAQYANVCSYVAGYERFVQDSGMNAFSAPANMARLQLQGIVPGGVAGKPLAVPSRIKSLISQDPSGQQAWDVLSTVYDQDPALQDSYPQTDAGIHALLAWAASAGAQVTAAEVASEEWAAPVSSDLFLQQYASKYKYWAISLSSGGPS